MTRVSIRIGGETSKQLQGVLARAYRAGDLALVKRVSALLAIGRGEAVETIAESLGGSPSTVYGWLTTFLVEGVAGLSVRWRGGRPCKLTPTQQARLKEIVTAGPQAAGFPTGCWNALLVQTVIDREFHQTYHVHYVAALLKNLGFSFQKARFVSDHLDEARRQEWLLTTWPAWRQRAQDAKGLLLFGDEASFAQWGSLGYTWAPIGQQPVVKTTGKRKAYKVFGLIEFFRGHLFYQGITGKFNAATYQVFLEWVLEQTTAPLFLVQDGAKYHHAATLQPFWQAHRDRLFTTRLPSYSPDYNPIEFLWRATKRRATHNRYFPEFDALIGSVEEALAFFATHPERVKALFGRYLDHLATSTAPPLPVAA
jgi:transposase